MSERPEDGVVDRWGRARDVPNLFVSDGSVMTTGAAADPTLTIVALAMRQADHIVAEMNAGTLIDRAAPDPDALFAGTSAARC
jgi:choline dehydrogenase-like flavoprotein